MKFRRGIWIAYICWSIALILLMIGVTLRSGLFPSRYRDFIESRAVQSHVSSGPSSTYGAIQPAAARLLHTRILLGLIIQWSVMLMAVAAIGLLLHRALALGERRGLFAATVTHELRTPVTTLRMYSQMLENGLVKGEERQCEYLATMRREADRLHRLVENVLTHVRLDEDRLKLDLQSIELGDALLQVFPHLDILCHDGAMELELSIAADATQVRLQLDLTTFERILFNLVENACKYCRHASDRRLLLRAERQDSQIKVSLIDHGPGIPPVQARHLFKSYRSGHDAAATGGLGLGLSISRRLAQRLGGELTLELRDGSGCCFVLYLPSV